MVSLYEKSTKKLELHSVLELLSEYAVILDSKEKCLEMRPSSDPEQVQILQAQTSAACQLIKQKGAPLFSGVVNIDASLARADRGGCLSARELLNISSLLRCVRSVKNYAEIDGISTVLNPLFWELSPNKYLEERIDTSILSDEEIADCASAKLTEIRRQIRIQSARIRESLQKIINSPSYVKYLRDPIITIRDGRFVVPVKSEHKSSVPGLVHDVSSSGNTFFIEPMQAVQANNILREWMIQEQCEIERILAELSSEAAAFKERLETSFQKLVLLDCIFARAKLSFQMDAAEPMIRSDGCIELKKARHPLIEKKSVVPITLEIGTSFDAMVITGPNTGGKTVSLKTIGLLNLMAQCGLHIPADPGSSISVFHQILADIGDEQSIEQSLSTFSAHMRNIVEIISLCDSKTLVLFDELGAGTDPAEGAALAIALIQFCRKCGAKVAATTHYAELKLFAMRTPGVINASCEFDIDTLRPTYRLLLGIPGKSNAFAISRKLGLPEGIIQSAGELLNENDANFEDVLQELEKQRRAMEAARIEVEKLRIQTQKNKMQADAYYQEIKKDRDKVMARARKEAQSILDEARQTANTVSAELKQIRKQFRDYSNMNEVNEKQTQLRKMINEAEEKLADNTVQTKRPSASRSIVVGDTVELIKFGSKATVVAINKDGTFQLQAGIMKVNAKADEVYLLEKDRTPNANKIIQNSKRQLKLQGGCPELDIRGMSSDEMSGVLGIFLDNAYLSNLPSARIIHGKGTGVLRSAVHCELKMCKYVKKFRLGVYGEGEDGVTIVEFI